MALRKEFDVMPLVPKHSISNRKIIVQYVLPMYQDKCD